MQLSPASALRTAANALLAPFAAPHAATALEVIAASPQRCFAYSGLPAIHSEIRIPVPLRPEPNAGGIAGASRAESANGNGAPVAKREHGKLSAQLNRVDLALDTYDDIFSDFDPSPYSSRIISTDLISEIMRRHRETKEGEIEVRFSIPGDLRNRDDEEVIRARLRDYFQWQAEKVRGSLSGNRRKATALLFGGLGLVTLHRLLSESLDQGTVNQIYKWFENPVELLGWIATWNGVDRLFLQKPEEQLERQAAFERFSRAKFVFVSEETIRKGI